MAQVVKRSRGNRSNQNHRKLKAIRKGKSVAKNYKCDQCDYCGVYKAHIKYHSVVHTGEKPFPCTLSGCSFRAGWKSALRRHLVTHVSERDKLPVYHCDQCEHVAASKGVLRLHQLVHENAKPFECDYASCNFRTKTEQRLARHKKFKHEQEWKKLEIYSCDQCDYSCRIKWNLSNHIKTHSKASIACEFPGCNFRCRLAWNLKVHVRRYHDPTGTFLLCCDVGDCTYKTIHKVAWKKHLEIHNPNREPSMVCTLCPRSFYGPEALERHVALSHTGEEYYSCRFCKFSCKYNILLKKHMSFVHASDQERDSERAKIRTKYKCNFCNYTSVDKHRVIKHELIHTGEKPLACSSCSFRTNDDSTLIKHMRVHGGPGEQRFECSICKVKFATRRPFTTHMKTVHSILAELHFFCQYCSYSSKFKNQLGLHISRKHGFENDDDGHTSGSLPLDLHKGQARKKKYPRQIRGCNHIATGVLNTNLRETLRDHSQRRSKLYLEINEPVGKVIFKCSYCSYSSRLAETMKTHLSKHDSGDQMTTTGMPAGVNGKERDQTVAVGSGKGPGSLDSDNVREKPKMTRVFACGLCDSQSSTYDAALLHSVDHRTLIISLERVIVIH